MDVSYFDTAFTDEPVKLTPIDAQFLARVNQAQFKGFSYTNKQYTATAPSWQLDNVTQPGYIQRGPVTTLSRWLRDYMWCVILSK